MIAKERNGVFLSCRSLGGGFLGLLRLIGIVGLLRPATDSEARSEAGDADPNECGNDFDGVVHDGLPFAVEVDASVVHIYYTKYEVPFFPFT